MPPEDDASPATAPSPTTVAWNWVLEALADSEECDFLSLAELIKSVDGVLKGPVLGSAAARERVALRFLKECVDLGCVNLPSHSMQQESDDAVFDVNERSEIVLCRFLQKVNNLDSKEMSKGASYIHGLKRFICEKKSTLPDIFLGALKDADFLHECSPFMMGDIGVVEGKLEDNSDASAEKNLKENVFELTKDGAQVTTGPYLVDNPLALRNDLSEHQKHSLTDTSLDGHEDPIAAKDDVHPRRHAETLKSFDLRTSGYQDEHVNVVPRGVASPKLHACCSVQVTTGPNLVDNGLTLQNNLSEHQKHLTKTALDGHRDPIDVEDDIHPRREADASKSSEPNTNCYQGKHVNRTTKTMPSSNMHVCSPEMHDKSHEVLSNGDGPLDMQEKEKFPFTEKCLLNLLSEDAPQKGLCIKCNAGGELLMCSGSDCPLAVHGGCLGLGTWLDDMGNFICPLCPLRRSFLLAKKPMLAFLNSGPVERTSSQEPILSKNLNGLKKPARQSPADEDHAKQDNNEFSVWTLRNKRLKNLVDNDTTKSSGHFEGDIRCVCYQHKVPLHNTDVTTNCGGLMNACNHTLPVNGGNNRGNDAQCTEMMPCQEIESQKLSSDNLAFSRDDATKNDARDDLCNKHGGKGSNCRHRNNRELHSHMQEETTTSFSYLSTFEEMAISEQSTKRTEDVHTPQTRGSSSKYKSSKKRPKRYANPVLPCVRRNKLPWTTVEEEFLKEAVQKFSNSSKGVFPWTGILEHGHHVFHRTRLPADLKDKWRNMQKREQKTLKR